jgi:hypothetical protein
MRNNQSKPGINWAEIEAKFNNGQSAYSLANDYDVTRQSITKRASKEGWGIVKHKVKLARQVIKATTETTTKDGKERQPTTISVTKPLHVQRFDKDTVETREAILALLRDGNPKVIAAQASGISVDTFNRWVQKDLVFAGMVREAESVAVVSRLQNIQKAGNRGDWKADSWYLERTQREIFGNNDNKNNALAVQINIHRDNQIETVDVSTTGAKPVSQDD